MAYNFDFDIMAFIFEVMLFVYIQIKYHTQTVSIRQFKHILFAQILMTTFDMISAIMNMCYQFVTPFPILLSDTMFFLAEAYTVYCFMKYVNLIVHEKIARKKIIAFFDEVPIFLFLICLVINHFNGFLFYIDPNAGYTFGSFHFLANVFPVYYFVNVLFKLLHYNNRFSKKQLLSTFFFMLIILISLSIQALILPYVLLSNMGCCIALFIMLASLETPDFQLLQKSLSELEVAQAEAQHANQAKSDFLANMSHEIRTPINAVLGLDEMILRESNEETILGYAAQIKSSGHTLLSLVNDILDFSKIESGKMEIIETDYITKDQLQQLILLTETRAKEKGLSFLCDFDSGIPSEMHGDTVRTMQVVLNLLTNAIKYTKEGQVTLSIHVKSIDEEQVSLYFSVKDTGIGIRKEDMDQLFTSFHRIDEKKNRHIEGTGLGLTITLRLLEAMGSTLKVDSEYGKGSDFHFVLTQKIVNKTPIGKFEYQRGAAATENTVSVYHEGFVAKDAKVLVVDDTKLNLTVFKGLLKKSEMSITTAKSGQEALKLLRENTYHIVFLDHFMPEMDGIETLHAIFDDPAIDHENTPIIALTANAVEGAREMYLREGFTDFLSKPLEMPKLEEVLLKYLPGELITKVSAESQN